MDPLKTRALGRTGVIVTELGFGTAGLGDLFNIVEDDDAAGALAAAWDGGIRYYDTAPWYGRGQSEHRVGRALYRRRRDSYALSTKIGRTLRPARDLATFDRTFWRGGLNFEHAFDYGYDGVMRSVEDSFQRLGIERIDLLVIHDLDFRHHKHEANVAAYLAQLWTGGWRALNDLKSAGVIRGIGAGINELGMIPRFLDMDMEVDFFLVALPYTLLEQRVLDREFPRCAEKGIGFVIGGVFSSGILATGAVPGAKFNYADATPESLDKVRRIEAVCKRHGVPLPAAALQFPLGHPCVASVIPGAILPGQVAANVASFTHTIPPALWEELKHEKLLRSDAPVPG